MDENAYYSQYYDQYNNTYLPAPSPYLTDGSKNTLYAYKFPYYSDDGNFLSDFNGINNTSILLSTMGSTWKTSTTIYDQSAPQCCWRYHTVGTKQGDWYLPAAGELGYLCARGKVIDQSLSRLCDSLRDLYFYSIFCSSTEAYLQDGTVGYHTVEMSWGSTGFNIRRNSSQTVAYLRF